MQYLNPNDLKNGLVLPVISGDNQGRYDDTVGINFYEIVTEFYQNAVFGQLPRTAAEKELLNAFENSLIQRSINGYGAVLQVNDVYYVPSTRYLWKWTDNGVPIGHMVGYPFRSEDNKPSVDRIRIFISEDGKENLLVQDWELKGGALGNPISNVTTPGVLAVWGNGKSDYDRMVSAVDWFNERLEKNNDILDKFSDPHLQGPANAADEMGGVQAGDSKFLGRSEEDPEYSYLTLDADQPLNKDTIGTLLDMLHMITGVPATAFGLSSRTGDSGISRERQMFAALSKTRRLRRGIEDGLVKFGIEDVSWVDDPFIDWATQVEAELALVTNGVTSIEEARERLNLPENEGIPVVPEGESQEPSERV